MNQPFAGFASRPDCHIAARPDLHRVSQETSRLGNGDNVRKSLYGISGPLCLAHKPNNMSENRVTADALRFHDKAPGYRLPCRL